MAVDTVDVATWQELAERYDGFIFDLFGVLHDGCGALPGAPELIARLKMNKKLVILSNSSKRAEWALKELPKLGLDPEAFVGAITSGEEAWRALREEWQGKGCVWLAKLDGSGVSDYLEGSGVHLAELETADFLLNSGTSTIRTSSATRHVDTEQSGDLEPFRALFARAIERKLPMLCANPDFRSPAKPGAEETYQPGHTARFYEELGGHVVYYGKPGSKHFEAALRLLAMERHCVCHVGDSMYHDVLGAEAAQINVAFVAGGIEHKELRIRPGEAPTAVRFQELRTRYGAKPSHVLRLAQWS